MDNSTYAQYPTNISKNSFGKIGAYSSYNYEKNIEDIRLKTKNGIDEITRRMDNYSLSLASMNSFIQKLSLNIEKEKDCRISDYLNLVALNDTLLKEIHEIRSRSWSFKIIRLFKWLGSKCG